MTTTTINTYYCAFCDAVANFFTNAYIVAERIGTARAAAHLASMGHYDIAKSLYNNETEGK
jgi:hypothetical protein